MDLIHLPKDEDGWDIGFNSRLTPHFKASELCKVDDQPPWDDPPVRERAMRLAIFLEWVRATAGEPIKVTSGYRSPEHNSRTPGSARHSQHCHFRAVDFRPVSGRDSVTRMLHSVIESRHAALGVYGLGMYIPFEGRHGRIHADFRPPVGPNPLKQWRKNA